MAHPAIQTTQRTCDWFRSALADQHGQHRVPPRMRSVQVGTAAVAIGVLGVFATPSEHEPQAGTQRAAVHQAAEAAPLSAPEQRSASAGTASADAGRSADSAAQTRAAADSGGHRESHHPRQRSQDPWAQRDASQQGGGAKQGGDRKRDAEHREDDSDESSDSGKGDSSGRGGSSDEENRAGEGESSGRSGGTDEDEEAGDRGGDRSQAPAGPPEDRIDRWIDQATTVLERNGVPREQLDHEAIRMIIEKESGGDPNAVNNWDSNASAGTPSKGLMQTIEPTFRQYAAPGHGNILHPVDNIVAATRYAIDRYGSVSEVPGVDGVRSGGSYQGY
ncbi:transglycosylase SLT domain-containing protein [Salinifilum ghardaiensis]